MTRSNLNRRLERLEDRYSPEKETWTHLIEFVDADGIVTDTLELGPGAKQSSIGESSDAGVLR